MSIPAASLRTPSRNPSTPFWKWPPPGKRGRSRWSPAASAQRYSDALMEEIPEIDGLLGVKDYDKALSLLDSDIRESYTSGTERFPDGERILTTPPYSAFVKISDGCDNRCSYCAIPLIRGRYLSRPYEEIVDECERLAEGGVTEITLIAQDTSRYGNDIYGKTRMSELLRRVAAIEKVKWVRVLYCYPDTTDDELLETIAHTPKVCAYLDLPLQHINDRLLKKMNRRGSSEWIKSRIEKCRQLGVTLRTTMIVGFPGETEEEFQELMDFGTLGPVRPAGRVCLFPGGGHPRRRHARPDRPGNQVSPVGSADDAPAGDFHGNQRIPGGRGMHRAVRRLGGRPGSRPQPQGSPRKRRQYPLHSPAGNSARRICQGQNSFRGSV